ncbi:hypothetical protein [Faecalimonas umbilicata]|uniref:hypothetical protein n=1 Tax=Faecalimonas umbilicata TaxID=1912855 RepID=UPI00206D0E4C|nr:hypothetical protein [Faecalimonas umbilicata]DAZ45508.1 MAG TPA: hypothetical protein [Caudoviricetes sp.]
MNYEEAGIKMISEFKEKIYQRRFNNKYFNKKGALLLSAFAYLNGIRAAGAITTEEMVKIKKRMIEEIEGE